MEPAVGLGCILKSARREQEEEDKKKQQNYIRASTYTSSMVVSQRDKVRQARPKKRRENTFLLFKRPQSPAG